MVPLGSKKSSLTLLQVGQGTLTAATAWAFPANPVPAHFRVTPIGDPQLPQAKSRSSVSSIMFRTAPRGPRERTHHRGGQGPTAARSLNHSGQAAVAVGPV